MESPGFNLTDALNHLRTLERLLSVKDLHTLFPNAFHKVASAAGDGNVDGFKDMYNLSFPRDSDSDISSINGARGASGGNREAPGVPSSPNNPSVFASPSPCKADISFLYTDLTQHPSVRNLFIVLYALVVVMSASGNLMVIWTVWRKRHMRTVTNYYIVNLAASDFLVALFVVPLKLLEYTAPCTWKLFSNDTLCSGLSFVLPVFVFSSVLTLVAISLERYYAIVHPLSSLKIHCKSRTRKIIVVTWVVAFILAGPYMYQKSYPFIIYSHLGHFSGQICTDRFDEIDFVLYKTTDQAVSGRFRKGFFFFLFGTIYLVPVVIILYTSVRIAKCLLEPVATTNDNQYCRRITQRKEENKRKVALMMIVVAVVFITSWTPFYVITFISQVQRRSFLRDSNYLFTMLLMHWFGFLNSCVNPVIYNFMNDKFHRSFRQFLGMLCRLCPCCCRDKSAGSGSSWTQVSLMQRPQPAGGGRRHHNIHQYHHHHHNHRHVVSRCILVKSAANNNPNLLQSGRGIEPGIIPLAHHHMTAAANNHNGHFDQHVIRHARSSTNSNPSNHAPHHGGSSGSGGGGSGGGGSGSGGCGETAVQNCTHAGNGSHHPLGYCNRECSSSSVPDSSQLLGCPDTSGRGGRQYQTRF